VAEATGQASRFLKIYEQYKNAPEVTRQRMYLETMERLFGGTDKIIVDSRRMSAEAAWCRIFRSTSSARRRRKREAANKAQPH